MNKVEKAICKRCKKEGEITLTECGYLPEPFVLARLGWYWSDNNQCWYCKPCEGLLVSEMFGKILDLCKENKVEVYDLHGNSIQGTDKPEC